MKDELISIIVPIYRVEKYLKRCIDSIIGQTYSNLEVILVDDGSPDACPKICDWYCDRDERIKVIHKQNGGLSEARNTGLNNSSGEYVIFIDSDDYVSKYFVEILYKELKKNNADVSVCSFHMTDEEKPLVEKFDLMYSVKIFSNRKDIMNNFFNHNCGKFVVAWNKLYKKALFNEINYPKGRNYEDEATTYKILYKASRVVYVEVPLYYYYQRNDSIMGKSLSKQNLNAFISLEEVVDFYALKGETRFENKAKIRYLKTAIGYIINAEKVGKRKKITEDLKNLFNQKVKEYKKVAFLPYFFIYYIYLKIKNRTKNL